MICATPGADAMKHLEPAEFFSKMTVDEDGDVFYELPKKPGWDPGGRVP
jgi:hypothetical protein